MTHKALSILVAAAFVLTMPFAAEAAKKKKAKSYSRSQFTAEQREKIAERGRAQCRKKFGATSRLYRVDYMHGKFWCSSYH